MIKCKTFIFNLILVVSLIFTNHTFSMKRYGKKGLALAALAGTSYALDKYDNRQIVDVSTPTEPKYGQDLVNNYKKKIIKSGFTKEHYFNSSENDYDQYRADAKKWVNEHCWVLSNGSEKITDLLTIASYEEQEARECGLISFVHGTQKGASILFRTILDEVIEERKVKQFAKLRNNAEGFYESAHAYFTTEILKYLKRTGGIKMSLPTSGSIIVCPAEKLNEKNLALMLDIYGGPPFDKLHHVREKLLSANYSLCSNYSWVLDGYKEGSLDYISDHCSALSYWGNLIYSSYCLLFCPWVIGSIIKKVGKDPETIKDLPYMLSEEIKSNGLDEDRLFKELFNHYNVDHLYEKYKEELKHFSYKGNAGIVQIKMPEDLVNKYTYISEPLGIMVNSENGNVTETIKDNSSIINYQARILLKPELIDYEVATTNRVSMKFYMYIKPQELHQMINRMYEIAQEIKNEIDSNV